MAQTAEHARLEAARRGQEAWRKWGPYLSERQWGTVREDYSPDGSAWDYFSHDQARSRTYQWGEDGLAGLCDDEQRLCFALALWNGADPILKERLFGLTNREGNHGEDVKEYYFYLDNTPTHSYMKCLYKYPQRAYPYLDLVQTNHQRSRQEPEYELLDTGVFADDRYFDVFVEYAKQTPDDILIQITIHNRGPEAALLRVLPTLWFRNTWSANSEAPRPILRDVSEGLLLPAVAASEFGVGQFFLYCQAGGQLLFTENETNSQKLFGTPNITPYVKDGIDDYLLHGRADAVNPQRVGTKAAAHYVLLVPAAGRQTVRLRLTKLAPHHAQQRTAGGVVDLLGPAFDAILEARHREADEFYRALTPPSVSPDAALVMRQALAGMLWSKQYYYFDVARWLSQHGLDPLGDAAPTGPSRNREWFHMFNGDIISMPDKWEYPWYAAWDLAFHGIALATVDPDLAKQQLALMLRENYLHPNGEMPAYEWNFGDVTPPVHAWATLFVNRIELRLRGASDVPFLKRMFAKLLLNFTWWVNRKDRFGKNVFEGGFLGLDNIGVLDRSTPLPTGGCLEQADGTAWMALYAQNMLELALELAAHDPLYESFVLKFAEHSLLIAAALNRLGGDGLWDEEDGFYYDLLRFPDGSATRLKVRSLVGLLPLCATTIIEPYQRKAVPGALRLIADRLRRAPRLAAAMHAAGAAVAGVGQRSLLAMVSEDRLRRILARMLDENEFLSPYGIRALSRYHAAHPYVFVAGGQEFRVDYQPADASSGLFGGNANWRGPVWFPVNALIIRALLQFYLYYGDSFTVECPTGSGRRLNLFEVARDLAQRLQGLFLRNADGRRPVFGGAAKFQDDPHWRDCLLFYEYFHGDNGAGIGASHQTGWTGLVGQLIPVFGLLDAKDYLTTGTRTGHTRRPEPEPGEPRRRPEAEAPPSRPGRRDSA